MGRSAYYHRDPQPVRFGCAYTSRFLPARHAFLRPLMEEGTGEGLRVAVVGCGYWGSKHVRVLHALDAVAEVAMVDSRADRLHNLVRRGQY